jgi:hypothetical protein
MGTWVRKYRIEHVGDEPPLDLSERARLQEPERRNRELEMENAFLKKRRRTSRGRSGERGVCVHLVERAEANATAAAGAPTIASALSKHVPMRPIDCRMPGRAAVLAKV